MPNTTLTSTRIKKRIAQRLGASGVVVELEDADLREVIEETLDVYNQARPLHQHAKISATTSQKRYVISGVLPPPATQPDLTLAGIVDVQFITRRTQPSAVDPFDPFDSALAGVTLGSGSGETYGEIEQRLGYSESAARIVDSEPEWEAVWEGDGTYVLYLDIPRSHIEVGVQYTSYYNNTDAGRQLIPQGDVDWFVRFCTAEAKQILGRIRSKHGGIANPEGGTDEIDGTGLIQEGAEEVTALREELARRRVPLGPTSPE